MKAKGPLLKWLALLALAMCGPQLTTLAQTSAFTYQGQLTDSGNPVTGTYDLRFLLFDQDMPGGVQQGSPVTNLAVSVSGGLFTVTIDFGGAVFTNGAPRWLEIASRTNGTAPFATLTPRQQITSTPYAITASNLTGTISASQVTGTLGSPQILDGAISNVDLAINAVTSVKILDGSVSNVDLAADAVTSAKILDGTIVGADLANNTVGSAQLADSIDLGTTNAAGLLNVYRTTTNTPSITLFGSSSQISTYGSDGQEQIRLWGTSYGEVLLYDNSTNNHTAVRLSAFGTSGGFLSLNQGNSFSAGANVYGDSIGGGRFLAYNSSNSVSLDLRSQLDSATAAAWVGLFDDGDERVTLAARNGSSGKGGLLDVKNNSSLNTIRLIGDTGSGDSRLEMYAGGTNLSFEILADDSASGSAMYLFNGLGQTRVEIDSDDGDNGAAIRMYGANGGVGLFFDAESANAGYLAVYGTNGTQRIILDGQSTNGNGEVFTDQLRTSGNVGIGRGVAANMLEVEGNASKTTAGSWLANSDARIKTDIQNVSGALETLAKVHPVSFRYTDEYRRVHPSVENRRYLNVVAQEFREVFPDDVKRSGERMADGNEILQVDTYPLTIYSAAAIQELNQKLTSELKRRDAENSELKETVSELKKTVDAMQRKLNSIGK